MKEAVDFTSSILPCWAEHGDEISGKCHIHAQMVQNSVVDLLQNGIHSIEDNLSDLCRTITIYDKCYIWQNDQFCGEKAWQFLLQLNERSSHALVALLNSSQLVDRIPSTCQQWLAPADYSAWHRERVLAFRRQTKSVKKSSRRNATCALFSIVMIVLILFF
uniref:Type III secretion protein n=1 Tax=Steinernema glaseri TaxID=37863 RepID=A0A1I8AB07_9BILA